jgi:hypothetical protein
MGIFYVHGPLGHTTRVLSNSAMLLSFVNYFIKHVLFHGKILICDWLFIHYVKGEGGRIYPPASEASREVANFN